MKPTAQRQPQERTRPGEVRIVGGQWKRTPLPVPVKPGLRPTPARVRETLFNWLGQDLAGWRCMDVFAGSGALGFEAASRGALQVLLVEQDKALATALERLRERLPAPAVRVVHGDGLTQLAQCAPASLDLVLLDPPFDAPLFQPALRLAQQALAPSGWVYLEAPHVWSEADLQPLGWRVHRHLKAGAVHAHLLRAHA